MSAAIGACGHVASAEPTRQELQSAVQQLQARLDRLQQASHPTPTTQDVDATVQQVLDDAQARSAAQLDVAGFTAGYSNGRFVIQSADGSFSLSPGLLMKVRYVTNYRENGASAGAADDTETGFEMRQMKLIAAGNVFSRDITYRFQTETDRTNGELFLQDFWLRDHFATNWSARAGQFKDIVHHEELVFDGFTLPVDRSLTNALIGGGRTSRVTGAALAYQAGPLRVEGLFHNGISSFNSPYDNHNGGAYFPVKTNFGLSARAEYFLVGTDPREYDDFTALGDKEDLLVLGGGIDWTQGGDSDVVFQTVDLQWQPRVLKGLAAYAALLGAYRSIGDGGAGTIPAGDYYDWGFLAQAAYLLNDKWEVFGRFDYTRLASGALPAGASDDVSEITAGVNYYWHGQHAKFTADVSWLPDGSPFDFGVLGILANQDNEIVFRAQFQLLL
jgi:hypothetical protein